MDNFDKYWKDIIEGGLFLFLGSLITALFNREKQKSEQQKNASEAHRLEAETTLAWARFISETQKTLEEMAEALQQMRVDKTKIMDEVSSLNAKNVELMDKINRQQRETFERELVAKQRIGELEKKVADQGNKVEVIEKKTGNLENKMPKHE